jgi:hypothetical protein
MRASELQKTVPSRTQCTAQRTEATILLRPAPRRGLEPAASSRAAEGRCVKPVLHLRLIPDTRCEGCGSVTWCEEKFLLCLTCTRTRLAISERSMRLERIEAGMHLSAVIAKARGEGLLQSI